MNIRRRLYLSLLLSAVVMALIFATLWLSTREMDLALERNAFAGDLNTNGISGLRTVTIDYILSPQRRALAQWQQRHSTLHALLATKHYAGTPEQGIIDRLRQRNDYLGEIFPKLARLYAAPTKDGLSREVEARLATQIMVATQDMITDTAELMRNSQDNLRRVWQQAVMIVAIAVAGMGLFVILNVVFAIRRVLNPIRELQRGTEIIGAGNLSYRTDLKLDNEVGALSRAFDAMTAKLAQTQMAVEANAVRLEESVKELEAFSYSVSHDLRAPLRGIDGWSLALQEDYGDRLDENGRQYLDTVRAEAQRLGVLIDDLLQLSRVFRGNFKRETIDLSALARTIAGRLQQAQPKRQIEFVIEAGLVAQGDPHLMEIALTNLLDNACKFTATRPVARIEVGSAAQQDATAPRKVFFVRDNGVGFDMAHANKLFSAFQRLHAVSEFPGTGIGLATVRRILHRHGGSIRAEAQPDQGATFYFTLGEAAWMNA